MMRHATDFTIIGLYFLLLIVVGMVFRKLNKNVDEYFRGGCKGTWWIVGMSAFMGGTGAGTFVAAAGMQYEAGFTVYTYALICTVSYLLMLITAPWFRQARCITFPEMVEKRYGQGLQQFYAVINVFFGIVGSGIQIWALSSFCASVFGFSVQATIIAIGIVVVLYSTSGGMWAVMGTDFLQGMIMHPILILLAVLSFLAVGGFSGFWEHYHAIPGLAAHWAPIKADGVFKDNAYGLHWHLAIALMLIPQAFYMGSGSRFFMVKTGADARKAQWLFIALSVPSMLIWCFPSFLSRLFYSEQVMASGLSKPAESAFAVAAMNLLPQGLTAMVVVAIFAGAMSSLGTGLNANAAMVTQDIYPFLCRLFKMPVRDNVARVGFGRMATLLSGMLLILLGLMFSFQKDLGVFETIMTMNALLWIPSMAPLFLGILIRKTPRWAGFVSISCGFATSLYMYVSGLLGHPWAFPEMAITVWAVSHLSYLATIPFYGKTPQVYKDKVNAFFKQMHTPVNFAEEVGESEDLRQLKMMGAFSVVIGLFVLGILVTARDARSVASILFVGLTIITVGCFLSWMGWRSEKRKL